MVLAMYGHGPSRTPFWSTRNDNNSVEHAYQWLQAHRSSGIKTDDVSTVSELLEEHGLGFVEPKLRADLSSSSLPGDLEVLEASGAVGPGDRTLV